MKRVFFFCLFFNSILSFAQLNIDSLHNALSDQEDSVKILEYYDLFWIYIEKDLNVARSLSKSMCVIASNSNDLKVRGMAIDAKFNIAVQDKDFIEAKSAVLLQKDINEEMQNEFTLSTYHQSLGQIYYYKSMFDSSVFHFEKAAIEYKRLDYLAVYGRIILNIGSVYQSIDENEKALEYFIRAFELFKSEQDDNASLFMASANIATVLFDIKRYEESLVYINQASEIADREASDVMKAKACFLFGVYYDWINQIELAKSHLNETIRLNNKQSLSNTESYLQIGAIYLKNNELDLAKKYLTIAMTEANRDQNSFFKIEINIKLAELYQKLLKSKKALSCYLQALDLSNDTGVKGERLIYLYENLMLQSIKVKSFDNALNYARQYIQLTDSLELKNTKAVVLELERKFNNKEQALKLLNLEQEAELSKTQKQKEQWVFGAILVLIILIALIAVQRTMNLRDHRKLLKMDLEQQKLKNELDLQRSKNLALVNMQHKFEKEKLLKQVQEKSGEDQNLKSAYNSAKLSDFQTKSWESFLEVFSDTHPKFIQSLQVQFPVLTQADIKHCVLIKSQMEIKDVARLLNISERGVYTARYRLKKKLGLEKDQDLRIWLNSRSV